MHRPLADTIIGADRGDDVNEDNLRTTLSVGSADGTRTCDLRRPQDLVSPGGSKGRHPGRVYSCATMRSTCAFTLFMLTPRALHILLVTVDTLLTGCGGCTVTGCGGRPHVRHWLLWVRRHSTSTARCRRCGLQRPGPHLPDARQTSRKVNFGCPAPSSAKSASTCRSMQSEKRSSHLVRHACSVINQKCVTWRGASGAQWRRRRSRSQPSAHELCDLNGS